MLSITKSEVFAELFQLQRQNFKKMVKVFTLFEKCDIIFLKGGILLKDTAKTVYRYTNHINGSFFISYYTFNTSSAATHLHFHNGCEIIFIEKGSYKFYAPEKLYEGSGPCIGMFQAGMYHGCSFLDCENVPASRYVINFTQALLDMIPSHMLNIQQLFENDAVIIPLDDSSNRWISMLFSELYKFYSNRNTLKNSNEILAHLSTYMAVMFNTLTDIYRSSNTVSFNSRKNDDEYIYKVVRELILSVENNQSISIEEMTERFHVGRTKLWGDFKRVTGRNIKQMANEILLERVKTKLRSGLSNREIVEQCNFSGESYFAQYFKKHMEMSPGEYRVLTKSNK